LTGVIMVGITYRSASARPSISSTNKSVIPQTQEGQQTPARGPAPSFKDKETYQELFKPLPKPEPIPVFTQFKEESKSWRQLQEEREALMSTQLEKTKCEALDIWNRAKLDDQQRVNKISEEQQRMEEEAQAREEILRRSDEERQARDKARREELRRQEELLSGRKIRSKTIELSSDDVRGTGIQIYHYKDPAVELIIRNHQKKEIKRRMSHGEILKLNQGNSGSDNNNEVQQQQRQNGATSLVKANFLRSANSFGLISGTSSNSSSTSVNEYKNVMTTKPDYFKASVMASSSSNTSR